MGLQGYVGSAEDQRRIRRQEKEREDRKRQFEDKKKQSDANVDAAGLRQFGTGTIGRWLTLASLAPTLSSHDTMHI